MDALDDDDVCGFCQEGVPKADFTDDDVLPHLLGRFRSPFIARICRRCNNDHGSKLEREVGRSSYFAVIRAALGIRSKHGKKKGKPHYDPLTGSPPVDVEVEWDGSIIRPARIRDTGRMDLPSIAISDWQDGEQDKPLVIDGMSEGQIAEMMIARLSEAKAAGRKGGVRIKHHDEAITKSVLEKVAAAGFRSENLGTEADAPMLLAGRITGELNEVHLRAYGYWLLKAMIADGYDPQFVEHLAYVVREGLDDRRCRAWWTKFGSVRGFPPLEQHRFFHRIDWAVRETHVQGAVTIFWDGTCGVVAQFRFPLGNSRSIICAGRGTVEAGYVEGGRAGEGWIELRHGKEIVRSSRPATQGGRT